MNIDQNTMNNIKNLVDNGNLSEAISNISPDMIQNFSKILQNQQKQPPASNQKEENTQSTNNSQNSFDLNNIDRCYCGKMRLFQH